MSTELRWFLAKLRRNGYYKSRECKGSHTYYENANGDKIAINHHPNKMVMKRLIKEHNLVK